MNNNQLVMLSGQFWNLEIDGDNIALVSTVRALRTVMSLKAFVNAVVMGRIQVCA